MKKNDQLEIARNILNNANKINMSHEVILKISQRIDKYIVEYYKEQEERRSDK